MSLVVPDVGERILLDTLVNGDTMVDYRCKLYQNNYTPDQDTEAADLTEATFSGYVEDTFTMGAATTVAHKGVITATAACVFTHNGGPTANTIHGYYVYDINTTEVVWVERFSSPQVMTNNGDTLSITLKLTANSE